MGKGAPKAPAAPDPKVTSEAQAAANKDTALWQAVLNNPNVVSPQGNVSYSQVPGSGQQYNMEGYNAALDAWNKAGATTSYTGRTTDKAGNLADSTYRDGKFYNSAGKQLSQFDHLVAEQGSSSAGAMPTLEQFKYADADKQPPRFEQKISLSPEEQRKFDLTNILQEQALRMGQGVLGNVGEAIKNPFSLEGLPKAPGMDDFSADRDKVVNALMERNQPLMDRNRNRMENEMFGRGITRDSNTSAWNKSADDIARQENDFRLAALNAGGAEQSRLFGLAQDARNNAIQERSLERSQPINEYATLLGLGGNVNMPQFSGFQGAGVNPPDVQGAYNTQYQAQQNAYNQKVGSQNATMGSLFGLAGSALGGWGSNGFNKFW